jgi:MFS family permease
MFRLLWLGVLISWIGRWMQTVGAQWLLVDEPNAAALVALVQVSTTLPLMLLALPGGILADSFDRRRLLITVQAYVRLRTNCRRQGGRRPASRRPSRFAAGRRHRAWVKAGLVTR